VTLDRLEVAGAALACGARRRASGALGDLVDLVGDEPVGLAVHCVGGLCIRRLDEAEEILPAASSTQWRS